MHVIRHFTDITHIYKFHVLRYLLSCVTGHVFLDGVALDISLNADESGWFRCSECGYQSLNREHYKMHVVIHRPPKWQCFYCDQKYPLMYVARVTAVF